MTRDMTRINFVSFKHQLPITSSFLFAPIFLYIQFTFFIYFFLSLLDLRNVVIKFVSNPKRHVSCQNSFFFVIRWIFTELLYLNVRYFVFKMNFNI